MKLTPLLGAFLFCWFAVPVPAAVLRPGVPIYVSRSEPEPVLRAVADLQRDLRAVLGAESRIVDTLGAGPAIVVLGPVSGAAGLRSKDVAGTEAHAVSERGPYVVLQGADMRGTIYAVYAFSETFLGVPPLWFWTSWEPVRRSSVEVPRGTNIRFGPPYVRWRAWFPNDEDLLTTWRARSQENYEAFLETMLRLKMNVLEGGLMDSPSFDVPYRIGRQAALARDRGLALTGHHMYIFGSSYRNWEAYWKKIRRVEPPRLSIADVSALEEFWRYHIECGVRSRVEMLWLIGFRGDRDIPFWETFADAPKTSAERGRVIQEMMQRQVALLKKVTGQSNPTMRVTLYNENSDYFAEGLLRPPDEPSLIWTFVAARRDHFPAADVRGYRTEAKRPLGYYMNFQFTSSGAHLAQAEGPWKMERNFRMVDAISGRPLEFSVVNAGNVREFLLELSANARMMWDFSGYRTDIFLEDFCVQYFGREHAKSAARLYRDYYDAFWTPKKPDIAGFERQYIFQDMRYARALEAILAQIPQGRTANPLRDRSQDPAARYFRIVPEDNGAGSQVEAIEKGTSDCIGRFDRLVSEAFKLRERLPVGAKPFFTDNLLVPARFMLELNRTLRSVTRALDVLPDRSKARNHIREAASSGSAMRAALAEAEHGRFHGWYAGDRLFGVNHIRELITNADNQLTPK
ncbi:MAG: glycosyl hydrolase 115 family protein [Acidobacteria bacterium]|nr:glycosyl hydrolase 115 family protein [Acidobacteriota bacterium]